MTKERISELAKTTQVESSMDQVRKCPECGSENVVVTAEQMFYVNTGDHYCHSVKPYDSDAKAACLDCRWEGLRQDLTGENHDRQNHS